jgi:hypothetical protein
MTDDDERDPIDNTPVSMEEVAAITAASGGDKRKVGNGRKDVTQVQRRKDKRKKATAKKQRAVNRMRSK